MTRTLIVAMALASLFTPAIDAQPTAPTRGAVFVAFYWRAKPGILEAYNDYIKTVAEPIDESARRAGVFEDVRTVTPTPGTTTDWTPCGFFA